MLRVPVVIVVLLSVQDIALLFLSGTIHAEAFKIERLEQKKSIRSNWYHSSLKACLEYIGQEDVETLPEPYCNATWDTILCWPPVSAGMILYQPCPPLRGLDPAKFASRKCGENGQWEGRIPGDVSQPQGWTNYTACYSSRLLEVYSRITKSRTNKSPNF